ncbi:MAG: hypothetical protein AAF799_27495 [Myxococcota bacterium]
MHAFARLRAPDGAAHTLSHGDFIGRLERAALAIDDGRVSEAHAMVSLRERELRLIALRGMFALRGSPTRELALKRGQRIELATGLFVEVEEVALPTEVLGIEGPGLPRQMLPPVASILDGPRPQVAAGWLPDAAVHVWTTGRGWSLRDGQRTHRLDPGTRHAFGEHTLDFVAVPLAAASGSPTRRKGGVDEPLALVASFDSVHVRRAGGEQVVLMGQRARVISELVAMGGPVSWEVLAGEVWPGHPDVARLRGRLDTCLTRLRRQLREGGIRTDLVRMDGSGRVELLLYAHDTVDDRT